MLNKNQIPYEEYARRHQPKYVAKADETLMTVADYAKERGITPGAVRAQLNSGKLDGVRVGKHWRVRVINDTAPRAIEIERLKAENEMLKMKLSLINDVLTKGEMQFVVV